MGYPIVYVRRVAAAPFPDAPDPRDRRPVQIASRVPVMWADASRASTAIASATASTGTHPLRSLPGIAARFAGVSMVLGSTAFTVIPWPEVSWESAWVNAIAPALATV